MLVSFFFFLFSGIIYLYTGDSLMMFFDGEKNTIKQQIQAEFQKNASQKPPKPTRGVKVNAEEDDFDEKKYGVGVSLNFRMFFLTN